MLSKSGGYEIIKKIIEVIRVNENKNVKWKYEFKNKLSIFIYYLKLFFIFKLYY